MKFKSTNFPFQIDILITLWYIRKKQPDIRIFVSSYIQIVVHCMNDIGMSNTDKMVAMQARVGLYIVSLHSLCFKVPDWLLQ